jgi:DNA-binding MarR family transcriptional regulator
VKTEELDSLATVYKALGNKTRLAVLLQLEEGEPVTPLTEDLDITRSGLQSNIERLIDANLVYRPVDRDPTYDLTELGKLFIDKIHDDVDEVNQLLTQYQDILQELEEEEADTLESMKESGIDTTELENKLSAEAWKELEKE